MKNLANLQTLLDKLKTKVYYNDQVYLKEKMRLEESDTFDHVASVLYDIYNHDQKKVGNIDLRLTMNEDMFYYGHIGYHILEKYRGHHLAYEACLVLKEIAKKEFGLNELIITCNPDNYASLKTILKLNPEFLGCFDVPLDHDLRKIHEDKKMIYRIKL